MTATESFGLELGPRVVALLPWSPVVSIDGNETSVVGAMISGTPVPSYGAIVTTAIACVVFTIDGYWKWNRTELKLYSARKVVRYSRHGSIRLWLLGHPSAVSTGS